MTDTRVKYVQKLVAYDHSADLCVIQRNTGVTRVRRPL